MPLSSAPFPVHPDLDIPADCLDPMEVGTCRGYILAFFFNPVSRLCQQFVYSGCSRSRNNFVDANQCMHRCQGIDIVYLPSPVERRQALFG